jgi:hypothetical protein
MSASASGAHLVPNSVALSCGSLFAGWMIRRTGSYYRLLIITGCESRLPRTLRTFSALSAMRDRLSQSAPTQKGQIRLSGCSIATATASRTKADLLSLLPCLSSPRPSPSTPLLSPLVPPYRLCIFKTSSQAFPVVSFVILAFLDENSPPWLEWISVLPSGFGFASLLTGTLSKLPVSSSIPSLPS